MYKKLHQKSGLKFFCGVGWVYEKRSNDVFHSKIDLRVAPYFNRKSIFLNFRKGNKLFLT